jgi:hypothetical protein
MVGVVAVWVWEARWLGPARKRLKEKQANKESHPLPSYRDIGAVRLLSAAQQSR